MKTSEEKAKVIVLNILRASRGTTKGARALRLGACSVLAALEKEGRKQTRRK